MIRQNALFHEACFSEETKKNWTHQEESIIRESMLKHFTKDGLIFRFFIVLNFVLLCLVFFQSYFHQEWSFSRMVYFVLGGLYLISFLFSRQSCYERKYRYLGIENHYLVVLWLFTYVFFLVSLLEISGMSFLVVQFFVLVLFLIFLTSNFVLLRYHKVDRDKTPPEYYSRNFYLKDTV